MTLLNQKPKATKCSVNCTISLIPYTAKIVARILRRRIEKQLRIQLKKNQFQIRRETGKRDANVMGRILSLRNLDIAEEMYACFVESQNAFVCVNWT